MFISKSMRLNTKTKLLSLFLFVSATILPLFNVSADPAQVVIFRHGEKAAKGVHLSDRGYKRANALVPWFQNNPVANEYGAPVAFFASYKEGSAIRAVETVTPSADFFGLLVNSEYKRDETKKLVEKIMSTKAFDGKTVVISWQHDNIIKIISEFEITDGPDHWNPDVFDRAYVIRWNEKGKPKLAKINLGLLPGDRPASISTEGKFPCGKKMAGELVE